jgi:hypothetical protein
MLYEQIPNQHAFLRLEYDPVSGIAFVFLAVIVRLGVIDIALNIRNLVRTIHFTND